MVGAPDACLLGVCWLCMPACTFGCAMAGSRCLTLMQCFVVSRGMLGLALC
jgi:hypothetical protein